MGAVPATNKAEMESAFAQCSRCLESVEAGLFVKMLRLRLKMHQEELVDAPADRVALIQGRAREIREILKKIKGSER